MAAPKYVAPKLVVKYSPDEIVNAGGGRYAPSLKLMGVWRIRMANQAAANAPARQAMMKKSLSQERGAIAAATIAPTRVAAWNSFISPFGTYFSERDEGRTKIFGGWDVEDRSDWLN